MNEHIGTNYECPECGGVISSPDFVGDARQEHVCLKPLNNKDLEWLVDRGHGISTDAKTLLAEVRRLRRLVAIRTAERDEARAEASKPMTWKEHWAKYHKEEKADD